MWSALSKPFRSPLLTPGTSASHLRARFRPSPGPLRRSGRPLCALPPPPFSSPPPYRPRSLGRKRPCQVPSPLPGVSKAPRPRPLAPREPPSWPARGGESPPPSPHRAPSARRRHGQLQLPTGRHSPRSPKLVRAVPRRGVPYGMWRHVARPQQVGDYESPHGRARWRPAVTHPSPEPVRAAPRCGTSRTRSGLGDTDRPQGIWGNT